MKVLFLYTKAFGCCKKALTNRTEDVVVKSFFSSSIVQIQADDQRCHMIVVGSLNGTVWPHNHHY